MFTLLRKWMGGGLAGGTRATTDIQTPSPEPQSHGPGAGSPEPAVFHVTHWKAGSQWIRRILQHLVPDRIVAPANQEQDQFLTWPIQAGKVYTPVYVTKEQFDHVALPRCHRRFVVIRDLRDALVSHYFSVKVSHPIPEEFSWMRSALLERDLEAGLLHTLEHNLPMSAAIVASWQRAGEPLLRYEDLLENDVRILQRLLLEQCELRVTPGRLREVVLASRFEKVTGGRRRGQEDITAHERKGISGDWRNYFTERIARAFKERFGELLIATGYEKDCDWRGHPLTLSIRPAAAPRRAA